MCNDPQLTSFAKCPFLLWCIRHNLADPPAWEFDMMDTVRSLTQPESNISYVVSSLIHIPSLVLLRLL